MTTVSPLATSTTVASSTETAQRPLISADFQTFLKMLTTQMQNQDPLNPMESTEFATQLATFSGVEQQLRTNSLLEQIVGGASAGGLAGLAALIGMEAEILSPLQFSGQPLTLRTTVPTTAAAELVVKNDFGIEISRTTWPAENQEQSWDGRTADGSVAPPGTYHFTLEGRSTDGQIHSVPLSRFDRVQELREAESGGYVMIFEGGETRPVADATALRRP